jgi:hypothetical protein
VPLLGGTANEGKSTLITALTSLSHLPSSLSPSCHLSRYPLSTAVISPPIHCHSDPTFRGHSPLPLVLYTLHCHPCPCLSTLLLRGAMVEDARARVANEQQRRMAGHRDPWRGGCCAYEGFCEDLARQITVAHLSQLQLRFRRRHTWVPCCRIWVSVVAVVS